MKIEYLRHYCSLLAQYFQLWLPVGSGICYLEIKSPGWLLAGGDDVV